MSDKRRCIGSTTFGIEAHDAPITDFPTQPSQKDGLGRMCKPHWTEYTRALRMAANASKTATARKEAAEPTVQSQAAARVATKRAARVGKAAAKARTPKQMLDALGTEAGVLGVLDELGATTSIPTGYPIDAAGNAITVETPAVKVRRQKLDATLAKVGVGSDEGQRVLEAANGEALRARGRKTEAGEADVEETSIA